MEAAASGADGASGRAPLTITPERQQLIGVRTAKAEPRDLVHVIRSSGRVAHDPELYAAIAEYLQALKSAREMEGSPAAESRSMAESLVRSSQTRLKLMGLGPDQLRQLAESAGPPEHLLLAPKEGKLWVYADIYQVEMPLVKPGFPVEARVNGYPGRVFTGAVLSVDPVVDVMTRTARLRAEVLNRDGLLSSEMFLDVLVRIPLGRRLSIPREAVLDTGEGQVVFVVKGAERFEPREVRTKSGGEAYVEVVSGLAEGEEVVASANFLIDSESRLKAALEAFTGREGSKVEHRHR